MFSELNFRHLLPLSLFILILIVILILNCASRGRIILIMRTLVMVLLDRVKFPFIAA
jgi:hypothetical protein